MADSSPSFRRFMGDRFERRTQRLLIGKPRVQTEVRLSIVADRPVGRDELGRLIARRFPAYSLTELQFTELHHVG